MPAHLNRKQQREIKAVVERAKKDNGIPQTAQQSIPFQRMFPDGICRVTDNYYTKTIQYQDINYQLAQQEDKTAIFDEWCSFLNFFDSSIHFELSFMNIPMFGVVLPLLPVLIVLDSSAGSSITAAMDGVSADKLRTGLKTSVILFRLLKQNQEI